VHPLPARRARGDDGHAGDVSAHPLGNAEGVHRPRLRQQQRELLAAEPPGQVVVAQQGLQSVRYLPDDLITEQVAVGIVDRLEPVDVQHGHCQRRLGPHRAGDLHGRLALPRRSVEQTCLGIDLRVFEQPGMPQRPLQQADEGKREDDRDDAVGQAERDKNRHAQFGQVVVHRLAGELRLAQLHGSIRALDRRQDQALVDHPHQDRAHRYEHHPARGMAAGIRNRPVRQADEGAERKPGNDVTQPDRGSAEHPPVHRHPQDPPLGERETDGGKNRRVGQRKQHRDRQFPDRVHVLDESLILAHSPGQFHGGGAAREQGGEQLEIMGADGYPGRRD
jgi:hypothetical protein